MPKTDILNAGIHVKDENFFSRENNITEGCGEFGSHLCAFIRTI